MTLSDSSTIIASGQVNTGAVINFTCPAGGEIEGFDANGDPICSTTLSLDQCLSNLTSGGDLAGCDLSSQDISGAIATDVSAFRTNFSNIIFTGLPSLLPGADVNDLSLRDYDTQVLQGDFTRADFSGAQISDAFLGTSIFNDADFRGATILSTRTEIEGGLFSTTNFGQSSLIGANFKGATVDAGFFDSHMALTDFDNATLDGSLFIRADLVGSSFVGASGPSISFSGSRMNSADFTNFTGGGLNLFDTSMPFANLTGAAMGDSGAGGGFKSQLNAPL